MSEEALKIISDAMDALGFDYEFLGWSGKPTFPCFVGEYQEIEPLNEDGMQESIFILTGYARDENALLFLERAKNKIKKYFHPIGGKRVIAESGSAVAIFYTNSTPVKTGDAELKKIQINLVVKEWSVS